MNGFIIVIEGTDGCGKQTQSAKLYQKLKSLGKNVVTQSFPNYDSISSGPAKMYLGGELGKDPNDLTAQQASLLFAVDRFCTFKKLGIHYENGGIIVLDRYTTSNMLHQGCKIKDLTKRDMFLSWLENLEFNELKLPRPDKVIFLDLPPKMSKKLANDRCLLKAGTKNDIHEQNKSHLIDAYEAGKYVAQKFGWDIINCLNKNGTLKSIDKIHNEILKTMCNIIGE
ncbi:MAG: thymidylate kinase [Clostridia bacterium]